MGAMNSIRSIAIVATGPPERSRAMMPPALSIWLKTQPPKMWPFALMSPGLGISRRMGSPRSSAMGDLSFERLQDDLAQLQSGHLAIGSRPETFVPMSGMGRKQ